MKFVTHCLIVLTGLLWIPIQSSFAGLITANNQSFMRDGARFIAKGMNYYPKDYAWIFWGNYDLSKPQIDIELDIAKELGVNTVRFFFPFKDYASYLNHLKDFVDRLQDKDMVAIVTLFDGYASNSPTVEPYSTGDYDACKTYISAVVTALGNQNQTVFAWDLKNEADRDYEFDWNDDLVPDAKPWLREMLTHLNSLDSNHLVTIGFKGSTDDIDYDPYIASEFADEVSFVSMHYYLSENKFEQALSNLQASVGDKQIVIEEVWLAHIEQSSALL